MSTLPAGFAKLILPFACLFSKRVFPSVQVLLAGAILAPGKRTVTSALRIMGLSQERHFQTYHRVLNRAAWSSLAASRILLQLLVRAFAPEGPLVFGLDDTIERRWGARIAARGIYRDPVRSSRSHFVKVSGLRWLCMMLRVAIPWAARVWALPFLTTLCPSERCHQSQGKRHKKLTDWARQRPKHVSRWLPGRHIIIVADSAFAALDFLGAARRHATVITRLRLDAALYAPAPVRLPGQRGRTRLKGERLPALSQVLADRATAWTTLTTPCWYGEHDRQIQVASSTAVWYHPGMPTIPLRWVLIRDPLGHFESQALLCTEQEVGEARNALARAVFFYRLGEIRDRSFEQQRYRASGLNLITAAIVLWNTVYLERATNALRGHAKPVDDALLQFLSPLGWEHINLTGDYLWKSSAKVGAGKFRSLRPMSPP